MKTIKRGIPVADLDELAYKFADILAQVENKEIEVPRAKAIAALGLGIIKAMATKGSECQIRGVSWKIDGLRVMEDGQRLPLPAAKRRLR